MEVHVQRTECPLSEERCIFNKKNRGCLYLSLHFENDTLCPLNLPASI